LISIYQGLKEENLDQKSPGPPGWGLMQRASYPLITKKPEMLKNQTRILGYQMDTPVLSVKKKTNYLQQSPS